MNARKTFFATTFAVFAVFSSARGAEFTFIGDDNASWSEESSYSENAVPSSGDTVTIAAHCVGVVTDENFDFVASLGQIVLMNFGELRFNVTGAKDFPVPAACYTTSSRTERSQITKNGSGTLNLSGGADNASSYRADLVVNEGNLTLYANTASGAGECNFNNLTVAAGATLTLPPYRAWTRVRGQFISVAGTVHCPFEGTPTDGIPGGPIFQTLATTGEIGGRITGNVIFRAGEASNRSQIYLTGTDNTFHSLQLYSGANSGTTEVGFKTFGAAYGAAGSLGTNTTAFVGPVPSRLLYLGEGETTAKSLNWGATSAGFEPATLDAGAHGGLTFTEPGQWYFTSSSRQNHDIVLTGSNVVECCWNGRFIEPTSAQGESLSTYVIKRGTGAWRFGENVRKWNQGVIAVEDGTLRFDTILPAGTSCSLGRSNRLRGRASFGESENEVPYAFLLGGEAGSKPVFEYSGSTAASCDTRPIGVKADATLANGTDCDFAFSHVFGVGDGAKTLTLAGESTTAANVLSVVTNACGTLSIAKDGAGTWKLTGVQDVNGEIFARKGTLVLEKEPPHYTWFRVNILQSYMNYVANPDNSATYGILDPDKTSRAATYCRMVNLQEFALYDAAGNRLNRDLATNETNAAAGTWTCALAENSAALVNGTTDSPGNGRVFADLFNDRVANNVGCAFTAHSFGATAYMGQAYPEWAISFVMRLADDVAEPTSFDWANCFTWPTRGRNSWYMPYALTIDASADGQNWTTINTRFTTDDTTQWYATCDTMLAPTTTVANAWVSDGALVKNTTGQQRALSDGKGFALNAKTASGGHAFERVTGYGVALGATLRARAPGGAPIPAPALTIDVAGVQDASPAEAVLDGFAFPAEGTLRLVGVPSGWSGRVPVRFENCTGVSNLADWTLESNVRARGTVVLTDNGTALVYSAPGLLFIMR